LVLSQVSGGSFLTRRYRNVEPFSPSATLFWYRILGTLAAGIQSGIGNVVAGSLFAGAQATAMGAGIPFIIQAIGGIITGIIGLIAAL